MAARDFDVIVHGLEQAVAAARAARAVGRRVTLHSAPNAGGNAGCGWWLSLVSAVTDAAPDGVHRAVLDCGADAGMALAALRAGVRDLRFRGQAAQEARLRDIAERFEAIVETADTPETALTLGHETDPLGECQRWFSKRLEA